MGYYYMNNETGEILPKKEALKMWVEEYDGNDPTNDIPFSEIFTKTDLPVDETEQWC